MSETPVVQAGAQVVQDRYLTFRVGAQLYALPADQVAEVIRAPAVARLPQGPAGLMGLANLRGAVLPVASARGLLGKPEAPPTRAIVLGGASGVALAVDRIEALVSVDRGGLHAQEADLAREPGERLLGVFRSAEDVVRVLDLWPMLEAAFARPRASARRQTPGQGAVHVEPGPGHQGRAERLLTFEIAGQEFALPLEEVREVISAPASATQAPGSDAPVMGLTDYRNSLLPLFSMRALLGLAPSPSPTSSGREKVLVTRVGAALAGLVVDRVRDILTVDPALLEATPELLAARTGGESRLAGVYRAEGGARLVCVLSRAQLFREDVMQKLGLSAPADEPPAEPAAELRILVFRLGDDEFGLPIDVVDEVARAPEHVARLPRAPGFIEGVINLRGEVLPIVDQRRRFDMPPAPDREARRLVVVRTAGYRAGLIVDSVVEVLRSQAGAVEPAPDLTGETTRLVEGVLNLDREGRMVMLLNPAELLTRAERGQLEALSRQEDGAGT